MNLYGFIHNDSVNYFDYLGLINWGQIGRGALNVAAATVTVAAVVVTAPVTATGAAIAGVATLGATLAGSRGVALVAEGLGADANGENVPGGVLEAAGRGIDNANDTGDTFQDAGDMLDVDGVLRAAAKKCHRLEVGD